LVRRIQDSKDGERTEVSVFDLSASTRHDLGGAQLLLEGELSLITGTTELAGTPEFPTHDVRQAGLALRAGVEGARAGGVLDFLYASGDSNLDDGVSRTFKADPNYSVGWLFFRHVLAGQTGRVPVTAFDRELVGVAPPGLERFPTRGSVSNTVSLFPRLYFRPGEHVELYGGALFAFAAAPPADPYYTRLQGGDVRNSFRGRPGNYYGTEVDVGLRWRTLIGGTELTAGLEGAWFEPGDAFARGGGTGLDTVLAGRLLLTYRL
jgi:hypothetical protein